MQPAERELLRETLDRAFGALDPARAGAADATLRELGWHELLHAEPLDAVEAVFRALGRANATASVLDDVVAGRLGVEPRDDLAVLLPAFSTWDPPGAARDGVRASGIGTARVATASELLVAGRDATGRTMTATVPIESARAELIAGVDPGMGLHAVQVDLTAAAAVPLDDRAWDDAVAGARIALAAQIAGACRTMLDLGRAHALEREQFGRPVARFQAVRHRLADALVAVEALDATLSAASDAPAALTAALAKATAGRSARTVARHCQQILAGIGFTTDHPFHRSMKRTMVLDGLFGSSAELVLDVGRQLVAARRVPTLIEL